MRGAPNPDPSPNPNPSPHQVRRMRGARCRASCREWRGGGCRTQTVGWSLPRCSRRPRSCAQPAWSTRVSATATPIIAASPIAAAPIATTPSASLRSLRQPPQPPQPPQPTTSSSSSTLGHCFAAGELDSHHPAVLSLVCSPADGAYAYATLDGGAHVVRRRADVSRHHHHHTQRARTPDAQAGSQAGLSAPHMHACAPPRPPWVAGWRGELRGGDRRRELDCPATSRGDFLDIFHVSRVYQCNPHVPSRTASLAILVPTRSPLFENSKSQKSGHVFVRADCRDLTTTSLCLRLCIGVKLRAASGP